MSPVYVIFFLVILIGFDAAMRIARCISYKVFRTVEHWMCKAIHCNLAILAGVRCSYQYADNSTKLTLPKDRPLLVISNHQSMYDVSLLDELFTAHEPRFISKIELAQWVPAVSFISRNNKTVLIDRNDRKAALQAMKNGGIEATKDNAAICIFPEGTRAKDGLIKKFKTAGLQTLIHTMPNALIVPVVIDGTWQILRHNFWPVPFGITVRITVLPTQEIDHDRIDEQLASIEASIAQTLA